jgi:fluoride exporter
MTLALGISIAGAFGAPARYLLDGFIQDRTNGVFPLGTFIINVTGSLVLGFLSGVVLYHGFPSTPKIILGTGLCGAYTTFSTFTYETVRLAEDGAYGAALRNALATLVVPCLAAGAGLALAAF